ncbi:hypothetical protein INT47_007911 [Mucor saturninus]|uniref:Uncharacterized protein n=1 Tax=Mucor saturninus TaxID=64648 RepID=A0A8H7QE42_9FUNG|nr:hypothetical protein INT47_007911 [Mucor saturninus]
MEPSTNSSRYVATSSFSARRGPRTDTLAEDIAGMKIRLYNLENPTGAGVSNVIKTGNDPEQCQFRLKEAESFNPARPLHKMTLKKTRHIKTRVRRNFEGLKYADRMRRTRSVEERGELARKKNQAARLTAKFKRRKDNFLKYEADIVQKFHPKESCRAFLVKAYMSEDEDDQVNDQGQALSYTSLRPSWRSDQLNEMFDELDSPSGQRNVGRPLPRRIRQVPSLSVPFEEIGRLPSWGVRNGI